MKALILRCDFPSFRAPPPHISCLHSPLPYSISPYQYPTSPYLHISIPIPHASIPAYFHTNTPHLHTYHLHSFIPIPHFHTTSIFPLQYPHTSIPPAYFHTNTPTPPCLHISIPIPPHLHTYIFPYQYPTPPYFHTNTPHLHTTCIFPYQYPHTSIPACLHTQYRCAPSWRSDLLHPLQPVVNSSVKVISNDHLCLPYSSHPHPIITVLCHLSLPPSILSSATYPAPSPSLLPPYSPNHSMAPPQLWQQWPGRWAWCGATRQGGLPA